MVGQSFGPTSLNLTLPNSIAGQSTGFIHMWYVKAGKKMQSFSHTKITLKNSPRHLWIWKNGFFNMDGEYYDRWTLIFQIYDASLQSTTFQLSNQLILKVTYPWMPSRKQHIVESTTTVSTQASPVPKLDHYRQPALPNALMNRSSPSRTKECVPWENGHLSHSWHHQTFTFFCIQLQAASQHHFFPRLEKAWELMLSLKQVHFVSQ